MSAHTLAGAYNCAYNFLKLLAEQGDIWKDRHKLVTCFRAFNTTSQARLCASTGAKTPCVPFVALMQIQLTRKRAGGS
jgi:hypothetical protein